MENMFFFKVQGKVLFFLQLQQGYQCVFQLGYCSTSLFKRSEGAK